MFLLAILFALQNNTFITIKFLAWQFQGPLGLMLLLILILGIIMGFLITVPAMFGKRAKSSGQERGKGEEEGPLQN